METRERYAHAIALDSRWMDNDAYGHVDNIVFYSSFDTAVNRWLVERQLLNVTESQTIGLVADTGCRYLAPVSFPDRITVGLRVAHLGSSSVRYELAVFRNDERTANAVGHFVHVCLDRTTRRPTPVPNALRSALSTLQHSAERSYPT